MTPLFGMSILSTVLPPDEIKKSFLPIAQSLAGDKVANVRMNVAKSMIDCSAVLKQKADIVQNCN
jgi:hypothetical protein